MIGLGPRRRPSAREGAGSLRPCALSFRRRPCEARGTAMYEIIREAIQDRACLSAYYEDYVRFFSPYALGKDSRGAPILVAFQYEGGRRGGLPAGGDWATFYIAGLSKIERTSDTWRAGRMSRKPIDVFKHVDIAAEPQSGPRAA